MIATDNKLLTNNKKVYKPLVLKKKKTVKRKKTNLFSYDDFDIDDFFFGREVSYKKTDLDTNIQNIEL